MDEYEIYQEQCKIIKEGNIKLLLEFETYLVNSGLAKKTIKNHVSNVEFYINEYLLYEEPQKPESGTNQIGWFLGDWFIRKAMWASKESIKRNAASLKKFYTFMEEQGLIEMEVLNELKEIIKYEMKEWLDSVE